MMFEQIGFTVLFCIIIAVKGEVTTSDVESILGKIIALNSDVDPMAYRADFVLPFYNVTVHGTNAFYGLENAQVVSLESKEDSDILTIDISPLIVKPEYIAAVARVANLPFAFKSAGLFIYPKIVQTIILKDGKRTVFTYVAEIPEATYGGGFEKNIFKCKEMLQVHHDLFEKPQVFAREVMYVLGHGVADAILTKIRLEAMNQLPTIDVKQLIDS